MSPRKPRFAANPLSRIDAEAILLQSCVVDNGILTHFWHTSISESNPPFAAIPRSRTGKRAAIKPLTYWKSKSPLRVGYFIGRITACFVEN
jgi:hypothetical protein